MGRSNERKAQLLTIMRAHRERATCTSEFSRTAIAHEAGVTPQYLSMLIGPEFHAAAQGLPGVRRTAETTLASRAWRASRTSSPNAVWESRSSTFWAGK